MSAITLLEYNGLLRRIVRKRKEKQGWLIQAESRVEAIRRHLSGIDVVLKCKEKNHFTNKQKKIEKQVRKRFGKATKENLLTKQMELKQDLKCVTEKMRRRKLIDERRMINRRFSSNPKSVYRNFRKKTNIEVQDPPSKANLTQFWGGIWGTDDTHNVNANWLEFCKVN